MDIITNSATFAGVPEGALLGLWAGQVGAPGRCWRLIAGGDIGLSGAAGRTAEQAGGLRAILKPIEPALRAADCVMANLETPLLEDWSADRMFGGSTRWAGDLAAAGIRVLHLASNHMLDFGPAGFRQTLRAVRSAGLAVLGAGPTHEEARKPVLQEMGGMKIAWLGAGHTRLNQPPSPRLWELDPAELLQSVRALRSKVDVLVVSLHWGPMLVDYPYLEQHRLAHELIDAGASAVLMHHAHLLQGVEFYKDAPVCYNLGNLLFDPDEGLKQRAGNFRHLKLEDQLTSCLFSLEWRGGRFQRLLAAPIELPRPEEACTPGFRIRWASPPVADRVLRRLQRISEELKGDFSWALSRQLWANRRREVALNLNLIFRQGQWWRLGYLARLILRWKHVAWLCRNLVSRARRLLGGGGPPAAGSGGERDATGEVKTHESGDSH